MPASPRHLRHQADRRGFLILAGCALALVGIVTLLVVNRPLAREADTQCPRATLASETIAIVDRTDPWNDNQTSLLQAALAAIARDVPVNGRLSLIAFDGTAERPPAPIFDRCNVGDGTSVNIATATPALVEKYYQANFAQPLQQSLAAITKPARAQETHLVAFLANVAGHLTYQARARSTRIVLFSNLAENTPALSVYAKGRQHFSTTAFTAHFTALVGDRLSHITLDIYLLPLRSAAPGVASRIKPAWINALSTNAITFTLKDL